VSIGNRETAELSWHSTRWREASPLTPLQITSDSPEDEKASIKMRLINVQTLALEEFYGRVPPYAILSHTWEQQEVSFDDFATPRAASMIGYEKIRMCCETAKLFELDYVWIDTCCIDKRSSADLSEAINSMYAWYRDSVVCLAYLSDVPTDDDPHSPSSAFAKSKWFTRGWTLQELLAPARVNFYGQRWGKILGTKSSLKAVISQVTSIQLSALEDQWSISKFSIAQKMSWVAKRKTTRVEDIAYCLLGVFGINMPIVYGEGKNAFRRLQLELMKASHDQTIFAWKLKIPFDYVYATGILASSPEEFAGSNDIVEYYKADESIEPFSMTNIGIQIKLPLVKFEDGVINTRRKDEYLAVLNCRRSSQDQPELRLAIHLQRTNQSTQTFVRLRSSSLAYFNELDIIEFSTIYLNDPQSLASHQPLSISRGPYVSNTPGLMEIRLWHDIPFSASQIYPCRNIMRNSVLHLTKEEHDGGVLDLTRVQNSSDRPYQITFTCFDFLLFSFGNRHNTNPAIGVNNQIFYIAIAIDKAGKIECDMKIGMEYCGFQLSDIRSYYYDGWPSLEGFVKDRGIRKMCRPLTYYLNLCVTMMPKSNISDTVVVDIRTETNNDLGIFDINFNPWFEPTRWKFNVSVARTAESFTSELNWPPRSWWTDSSNAHSWVLTLPMLEKTEFGVLRISHDTTGRGFLVYFGVTYRDMHIAHLWTSIVLVNDVGSEKVYSKFNEIYPLDREIRVDLDDEYFENGGKSIFSYLMGTRVFEGVKISVKMSIDRESQSKFERVVDFWIEANNEEDEDETSFLAIMERERG
jgi:hypothetical protein